MREAWKELQRREDCESEPLTNSSGAKASKAGAACGESATARKDEEGDLLDTGFTWQFFGAAAIRAWLGFQVVSLFFQMLLWREVSGYLSTFQETLDRECQPARSQHGICIGPMWNVSSWQDAVLSTGSDWTSSRSFDFVTRSNPPTFLVVVDPVSKSPDQTQEPQAAPVDVSGQLEDLNDVQWSLDVVRVNPPQGGGFHRFHKGQQAMTFEDFSVEADQHQKVQGRVEWRATLSSRFKKKARFVAFVEDSATPHLADVHGSPVCAFGRSWKSFNEQHQGRSHKALAWSQWLLGVFLLVGAGAVYIVHTECQTQSGYFGKYRFHLVVMAKFLFQDVPQQICIVLYLFGWYESNGLRCQLCLFHPQHCSEEDPFHPANALAILCTLLSAVSNQLLVRPVFKKVYTEDDICIQHTVRIGGVCIATLPFTTGMCWASQSILSMPTLFHVLFALPCGIGWLTLVSLVCFPVLLCCDEDF